MDDAKSLAFIADFERRIRQAPTDKNQEVFIRGLVADIAQECPIPLLTQLATCILNLRKSELKSAADWN
jgi:hypothetical protein